MGDKKETSIQVGDISSVDSVNSNSSSTSPTTFVNSTLQVAMSNDNNNGASPTVGDQLPKAFPAVIRLDSDGSDNLVSMSSPLMVSKSLETKKQADAVDGADITSDMKELSLSVCTLYITSSWHIAYHIPL
jgi:hypothetical protein